jgi:hypothetical protein
MGAFTCSGLVCQSSSTTLRRENSKTTVLAVDSAGLDFAALLYERERAHAFCSSYADDQLGRVLADPAISALNIRGPASAPLIWWAFLRTITNAHTHAHTHTHLRMRTHKHAHYVHGRF